MEAACLASSDLAPEGRASVYDVTASLSSLSIEERAVSLDADAPGRPEQHPQHQDQHSDHPPTSSRLEALPCELLARIAALLPPNEVPCCLRLVCRALAAALRSSPLSSSAASASAAASQPCRPSRSAAPATAAAAPSVAPAGQRCPFTTIRLSLPVPPAYFAAAWGPTALAAGATRLLTLAQRQRLLCLTAATGVVANLEVAEAAAALTLDGAVAAAAASRNQVAALRWLKSRGCAGCPSTRAMEAAAAAGAVEALAWMWGPSRPLTKGLLAAAAAGGSEAACEWLLECSCPWNEECPAAAARAGHGALAAWLAEQQRSDVDEQSLLVGVAAGLDLAALKRQQEEYLARRRGRGGGGGGGGAGGGAGGAVTRPTLATRYRLLSAAATSRTPDWRDKVVWLEEEVGYGRLEELPPTTINWDDVAAAPDALPRLTWLAARGALGAAARRAASAILASSSTSDTNATSFTPISNVAATSATSIGGSALGTAPGGGARRPPARAALDGG